jgi:hypothetical protein
MNGRCPVRVLRTSFNRRPYPRALCGVRCVGFGLGAPVLFTEAVGRRLVGFSNGSAGTERRGWLVLGSLPRRTSPSLRVDAAVAGGSASAAAHDSFALPAACARTCGYGKRAYRSWIADDLPGRASSCPGRGSCRHRASDIARRRGFGPPDLVHPGRRVHAPRRRHGVALGRGRFASRDVGASVGCGSRTRLRYRRQALGRQFPAARRHFAQPHRPAACRRDSRGDCDRMVAALCYRRAGDRNSPQRHQRSGRTDVDLGVGWRPHAADRRT